MAKSPKPPKAYNDFVNRFPKLAKAWEALALAGQEGPLDERTIRLVKLALAIGALREGAVSACARKAAAAGVPRREIDQVVSLAAGTIGLPSTVAAHTWVSAALRR